MIIANRLIFHPITALLGFSTFIPLLTLELPSKPVWNPQFLQMQHCQQLLYCQYYLLPNNDDGF
ncbi:unnamed protein product [Brugia pahangi]|uniref:Secreted protein n=1 Tax=Brugia pahangi TaxID=6280 RepID=A0A0N4TEA2_BRUPA|nr:unnamed protein product [Brugia pahangi]